MVEILANSLIPVFAGLLVGYIAGIRKIVDNKDLRTLITFVMSFRRPLRAVYYHRPRTPRVVGGAKGVLCWYWRSPTW